MTDQIEISGIVRGLVDLDAETVTYGPIQLMAVDGDIHFVCRLDVEGFQTKMVDRVCTAVESVVLVSTGAAVNAVIQGYSYPKPQDPSLRTVVVQRRTSWSVRRSIQESSIGAAGATEIVVAVLEGSDEHLGELLRGYHLGVQASQSLAPLAGLWAFSTILEEESPPGQYNLKHLPSLIEKLQQDGLPAGAAPSSRKADQIRAAALHPPTPKSPKPTEAEIQWFRDTALSYLIYRARHGPGANARRKRS